MPDRDVEVWLIHPLINSNHPQQLLFAHARKALSSMRPQKGWDFRRVRTKVIRPHGRPMEVVSSDEATSMYKRAHRARIGIWDYGNTYVPLRSDSDLARNPKHYRTLKRFLCHKAFYFNIGKKAFTDVWEKSLESFQEWLDNIDCEGQTDPRCLPFHIFRTSVSIETLATTEGRRIFTNKHHPQSNRPDDNGLHWRSPRGALHGNEQLHISGRELERGFHWDVDSGKRKRTVFTTEGKWKIQRGKYLNIYPDGYIRLGSPRR